MNSLDRDYLAALGRALTPRERSSCLDCGTPFVVAAGPGDAALVPACWCAEDKRKAELKKEAK